MDDQRYAEIDARRERNKHFRDTIEAANHPAKIAHVPKQKSAPKLKPKPVPKVKKPASRRGDWSVERRKEEAIRLHGYRVQKAIAEGRVLRPAPIKVLPSHCLKCKRPMRGRKKSDVVDGSTVQHASQGFCNSCVRRRSIDAKKASQ